MIINQAAGKVYLIPTVIAPDTFEESLPTSVKTTVNKLSYFLVENVRTARRFLSAWGIEKPISSLRFEVLDKRSTEQEIKTFFEPVLAGQNVGIMSEAGCPGVADPGTLAVEFAHRHKVQVVPLVGPSSFLLALMASGLSGQSFAFHAYLPIDKQERGKAIRQLERQSREQQQTQIFMETPYRNEQLMEALLKHCQPHTRLCIAKGISGPEEMIRTMPVKEWKKQKPVLQKVPTVFLMYG
ncbi:MAG: SAM-dependent methyltransferase [Cyclobacteriaceae bacterium]